jgi:hypothetical protein
MAGMIVSALITQTQFPRPVQSLDRQEKHTPPLFLARIWSIVLSLLRDADCENDRVWPLSPLAASPASIPLLCVSLKHLKLRCGVVCDVEVEVELYEANVRRATRGAALFSRAFAARTASLHEADILLRYIFVLAGVL